MKKNKNLQIIENHPDYEKLINWLVENKICSSDSENYRDAAVSLVRTYANIDSIKNKQFIGLPKSLVGKLLIESIIDVTENIVFPTITKYKR
jgi:hypothetical protein